MSERVAKMNGRECPRAREGRRSCGERADRKVDKTRPNTPVLWWRGRVGKNSILPPNPDVNKATPVSCVDLSTMGGSACASAIFLRNKVNN